MGLRAIFQDSARAVLIETATALPAASSDRRPRAYCPRALNKGKKRTVPREFQTRRACITHAMSAQASAREVCSGGLGSREGELKRVREVHPQGDVWKGGGVRCGPNWRRADEGSRC
ncbi:hypothetical protein EVAR_53495_1 [Eumeta japonica]|uniref:Uncharacterized protein n=1 Tax=Eumeta variegata TaxID=151549 RepID=A0A4C1Y3P0_EUMVA|nr:hypothetical protein EVAR_53495_1 [Eumeta japonica]